MKSIVYTIFLLFCALASPARAQDGVGSPPDPVSNPTVPQSEPEVAPDGDSTPIEPPGIETPRQDPPADMSQSDNTGPGVQEKEVPPPNPETQSTPEGSDTAVDPTARELEAERRRWSMGGTLGYSRFVDSVNSSRAMSYAGSVGRRADDNSSWNLGIGFAQDGLFRDDATLDGISWGYIFAFDKNDPSAITFSYAGNFIEPQKLGSQGYRVHQSLAGRQNIYATESFTITARASCFLLLTEYDQTVTGQEYTRFGFGQVISGSYVLKNVSLAVGFGFDQGYRNESFNLTNSNFQTIEYGFTGGVVIGISHSLSALVLDPIAKNNQPKFLLGDEEMSQVGLFVGYSR